MIVVRLEQQNPGPARRLQPTDGLNAGFVNADMGGLADDPRTTLDQPLLWLTLQTRVASLPRFRYKGSSNFEWQLVQAGYQSSSLAQLRETGTSGLFP
jgi:hypothetical protein